MSWHPFKKTITEGILTTYILTEREVFTGKSQTEETLLLAKMNEKLTSEIGRAPVL